MGDSIIMFENKYDQVCENIELTNKKLKKHMEFINKAEKERSGKIILMTVI